MFLPNTESFLLRRRPIIEPNFAFGAENHVSNSVAGYPPAIVKPSFPVFLPPHQDFWCGGLPNSHSFLLIRRPIVEPSFTTEAVYPVRSRARDFGASPEDRGATTSNGATIPQSADSEQPQVIDQGKRNFLKVAGIAGAGLVASLLLPKKADALIMGSSPTTGVVGVKNAANTRINPATQETVATLLKTSDLTFAAGDLQVKVTSLPAGGSSFSDSAGVAKSGLVNASRNVQVDVLSSALPSTASTETTLSTISFGGFKFTLRLETVGTIDYVGEAAIGTATSAALWRIKRLDNTTGTVIQWAGTGVFNQIWDSRTSLTYS